jgi:hypothetical protein
MRSAARIAALLRRRFFLPTFRCPIDRLSQKVPLVVRLALDHAQKTLELLIFRCAILIAASENAARFWNSPRRLLHS